ncbi:MAG: phosphotransferase [Desulfobulbaceae bacterium]|nr:phosphotransferase [Desulfobulbaceae bacterium]
MNWNGGKVEKVYSVAGRFFSEDEIVSVEPYGSGKVNDTFLVTTGKAQHDLFMLQRLSPVAFSRPEHVMENLRIVSDHVHKKIQNQQAGGWKMPVLHQTLGGDDFYRDSESAVWRVMSFIDQTTNSDTIEDEQQAGQAGFALGLFHRLISDIDPIGLHDTLPGFHITPAYLAEYDKISIQNQKMNADIRFCHGFIASRRGMAHVLEKAKKAGHLFLRPIHGDPKLSNILFDKISGKAVSLIDLDTVKPGLVHYDIGDCLRSCCNPAGEEKSLSMVTFDTDLCRAILQGYFKEGKTFFSARDFDYLFEAVQLISFELGLRFFSDFLLGNRYFKTDRPDQNLHRALVQFALTESIEEQKKEIRMIIKEVSL